MTNNKNVIFDLSDPTNKYKGVLFAIVMIDDIPKQYWPGLMALIWEDAQGLWHFKCRLKYSLGNKQAFSVVYNKDVNVTIILTDIYKRFSLINKRWLKNEDESIDGIIELLKKSDMIEYMLTIKED